MGNWQPPPNRAHQGNTDFSVYFGKLVPHSAEFVAELAIVLSFDNFSKFLRVLKNSSKGLQNGGRKEESMAQVNHKAKPADVVEKGMTLTFDTFFFSPNKFLTFPNLIRGESQIYFGRDIGEVDGKTDRGGRC